MRGNSFDPHEPLCVRRDFWHVIAQKRPPALTRRSDVPFHVLGDSGLRDLEAQLEKLAMDARRAPEWVIQAHLPDERAQVRIDLRAPSSIPGLPSPVAAKPSSMPAN